MRAIMQTIPDWNRREFSHLVGRWRRQAALGAAKGGQLLAGPIAGSRHGCRHGEHQAPRERPGQALRGKGGAGELPERTGPGLRGSPTGLQVHKQQQKPAALTGRPPCERSADSIASGRAQRDAGGLTIKSGLCGRSEQLPPPLSSAYGALQRAGTAQGGGAGVLQAICCKA